MAQRLGKGQDLIHAGHKWLCFLLSNEFARGYYYSREVITFLECLNLFIPSFSRLLTFSYFLTWPTFNYHRGTAITCSFKSLNNPKCLYPSRSLLTTNQIRNNYITCLYFSQMTSSDFWVCQQLKKLQGWGKSSTYQLNITWLIPVWNILFTPVSEKSSIFQNISSLPIFLTKMTPEPGGVSFCVLWWQDGRNGMMAQGLTSTSLPCPWEHWADRWSSPWTPEPADHCRYLISPDSFGNCANTHI